VIQIDTVDFGELYAYSAVDIYPREAQVVLLPGLTSKDGGMALELVMAYFGSCKVLQTDGGKEFEEKVSLYAQRHRMARPYRKNEQAFVESFHRTLRKECLGWCNYKISEMEELQREVQEYLNYYHCERPHLGLDMRTPLPSLCRISYERYRGIDMLGRLCYNKIEYLVRCFKYSNADGR